MILSNYESAAITIIGMTMDSVGGLYLAYDLLGGQDGPLSQLTRIVNYSLLFFIIFLFGWNLKLALIGGIGLGTATAFHMRRIGHDEKETPLFLFLIALLRGVTLFLAISCVMSRIAAVVAGSGLFLISFLLPLFNMSPKIWYQPGIKPTFNKKKIVFSFIAGLIIAALISSGEFLGGDKQAFYGTLRTSLVVTFGVMIITVFAPTIEWWADNVPDKRMGYIGVILFLSGFAVQSIPSMITLLSF